MFRNIKTYGSYYKTNKLFVNTLLRKLIHKKVRFTPDYLWKIYSKTDKKVYSSLFNIYSSNFFILSNEYQERLVFNKAFTFVI